MKTYGELKAAIADYLNREDLAGNIPDFVRLAEAKIYRRLRTRENEFLVEYTAADDPFVPITLPQNFREIKQVTINGLPAEHISDQEYQARISGATRDWKINSQYYFAIVERALYVYPWPTETQTAEEWDTSTISVNYYGTESLTDMAIWTTPTNPNAVPENAAIPVDTNMRANNATTRLLQVAPDAYFYASMAEAHLFLQSFEEAGMFAQMAQGVLDDLEHENAMATLTGSTVSVSSIYFDGVGQ